MRVRVRDPDLRLRLERVVLSLAFDAFQFLRFLCFFLPLLLLYTVSQSVPHGVSGGCAHTRTYTHTHTRTHTHAHTHHRPVSRLASAPSRLSSPASVAAWLSVSSSSRHLYIRFVVKLIINRNENIFLLTRLVLEGVFLGWLFCALVCLRAGGRKNISWRHWGQV